MDLASSEAQLLFLAENVEDVIFLFRLHPTLGFEYVSAGVGRLTGYTAEEYYARPTLALETVHPDDIQTVSAMLRSLGEDTSPLVVRVVRKDGTVIWTEQRMKSIDGGATVLGVARDVTDRVFLEEQLRMLALDDDLTGLRNRRGFILFGNQLLSVLQRAGRPASLVFLDVDHLKQINDADGHVAGDVALVEVARAMRDTFRDADVLARIGGDEFAILLGSEAPAATDGVQALSRLRSRLDRYGKGRELSVSGGIAHWDPTEPPSIQRLMAEADRSMYRDKGRVTPTPETRSRRILVVDDLAEMRLMMRLACERADAEVVGEAADGAEAVRLAESLSPDVVLLDLRMPGTDGLTAIPKLRTAVPDAVIIVVTVLPPGPETRLALDLGAHHCLPKTDIRSAVELAGAAAR